jgi:hypothetical protein
LFARNLKKQTNKLGLQARSRIPQPRFAKGITLDSGPASSTLSTSAVPLYTFERRSAKSEKNVAPVSREAEENNATIPDKAQNQCDSKRHTGKRGNQFKSLM